MERESFEDAETARLLNENFVSVKVDREERPDVDHFYMEACVGMTGQGGWPLSCFLSPDKKPFYAGTYFPKEEKYATPSFQRVLKTISRLWEEDRGKLVEASAEVMRRIAAAPTGTSASNGDEVQAAYRQLKKSFDPLYGGFGSAPKFPAAHNLLFLLRYGIAMGEDKALEMADHTLRCMARGGMFDHIGGGFCRYSPDRYWLVPHFEKMMYDNAMLMMAYAEAGALLGPIHFKTVRRIADYCFTEMRDKDGAFFTAQDADSEGVEGKYYVFSQDEIAEAIGSEDMPRFCGLFDITEQGNFEGKSIPNHIGKDLSEEERSFADAYLGKLYAYRQKRVPPAKDDKKLAMVNALMTAALSVSGKLLNDPEYIRAAGKCADFILRDMTRNGRLFASFRQGVLKHPAVLEDYAYLCWALLELYEATLEPRRLEQCIEWTRRMVRLFGDAGQAFYMTGSDISDLPLRSQNIRDNALPSGNAVAASVLLRLATLLENDEFAEKAKEVLAVAAGEMGLYPAGFTALLGAALLESRGMLRAVIIEGPGAEALTRAASVYNPFAVTLLCGQGYEAVEELAPEVKNYKPKDGKATAYICGPEGCREPMTGAYEVRTALCAANKAD